MRKPLIVLLSLLLLSACASKQQEVPSAPRELNIYNWEDYFAPETISDFEQETGIKTNLFIFEDEQFMFSDVQSNPGKYDVIMAGNSLIREMTQLKLLSKLDHSNIPNKKNIDEAFLNQSYDPENRYSVPYLWGTTGIAINTKYVGPSDSWSVMWNPDYKGKMSMLNSQEQVINVALKFLGHSVKTADLEELGEARKILLEQKPLLRGYEDPIAIRDDMIAEKLWLAHMYSGDAIFARDANPSIVYIIPKEGTTSWVDNLAIPEDARNKKEAEQFINFILRPDVSAKIANYVRYANPNKAAKEFTDSELLDDPSLYPSERILSTLESFGAAPEVVSEYNKIWAELQS